MKEEEIYEIESDKYIYQAIIISDFPVVFRQSKCKDYCEVKFDNNFAKASGFQDINDLIEKLYGLERFKNIFGNIPEWIEVLETGDFRINENDCKSN